MRKIHGEVNCKVPPYAVRSKEGAKVAQVALGHSLGDSFSSNSQGRAWQKTSGVALNNVFHLTGNLLQAAKIFTSSRSPHFTLPRDARQYVIFTSASVVVVVTFLFSPPLPPSLAFLPRSIFANSGVRVAALSSPPPQSLTSHVHVHGPVCFCLCLHNAADSNKRGNGRRQECRATHTHPTRLRYMTGWSG